MTDLFLNASRKAYRYSSKVGLLTTEQLWNLPLTSATGKANLNDVAVALSDEIDTLGAKSFVSTASTDPRKADLNEQLDIVKFVIATKQAENAKEADRRARRDKREKLLNAVEAAENRELGSKSVAELRAELAALDD